MSPESFVYKGAFIHFNASWIHSYQTTKYKKITVEGFDEFEVKK